MMFLLVFDVANYTAQLRPRIRERTESFLPRKTATDPSPLVDVIGRACFDAPDQIGWCLIWFQPKKNVRVIWHTIDRNKLLIAPAYDSRDVFLKFLLTLGLNDTCTPRNGKDDMQIDCVDAENTFG